MYIFGVIQFEIFSRVFIFAGKAKGRRRIDIEIRGT
jgi:hypothetical protein